MPSRGLPWLELLRAFDVGRVAEFCVMLLDLQWQTYLPIAWL